MLRTQSDIESLEQQVKIMEEKLNEIANRPEFSSNIVMEKYFSLEKNLKICNDSLQNIRKIAEIKYFL